MKTTEKIILIDGNFSPTEAKELLMNLFINKINFHEKKNFSSHERYGKEDKTATRRIPELKESVETISQIITEATAQNQKIVITSTVNIHFSNTEE
ncbi:hypothetical protein [Flavobacterium taihuense]|uniref:Uncharacterized protein n=1 Tax=Flavobacterium taihuense TaxID=2857508 RepID=A0ABS6XYI5_9FLAO|nr:hypothetical protein [Flavobacterium taihuense]MBW4361736.1 hypothetical protein [Flavobacterium taihuense]